MSNKKRPYLVVHQETGEQQMIVAISQAQAISFVARALFEATPADALEVMAHMQAGGRVSDATGAPAPAQKAEPTPTPAPTPAPSRDDGEERDDDDVPDPDAKQWGQHLNGGIGARTGGEE